MNALFQNQEMMRTLRGRARAHADILQLPLRNKIWQGASGDFAGRGSGSSLDFQDHRAYAAGDDPRHINWQAYARTGQYTMKLFREEVRPVIDLVFDVSPSMFFLEGKACRSLELFFYVSEAALRSGAALKVFLINGERHSHVPLDALRGDAWLALLPANSATAPPSEPPAISRIPLRPQSMRIFVSDLLYPGSPDEVVRALSARQGRGIIFAPSCQAEGAVDWEGNYEFVETESRTTHLRRVDAGLLKKYHAAYRRHFELWKALAQKYGVLLSRVASEPDLQAALRAEALRIGAVEMY